MNLFIRSLSNRNIAIRSILFSIIISIKVKFFDSLVLRELACAAFIFMTVHANSVRTSVLRI